MLAKLTTHVLDTAHGCPARGLRLELWSLGQPAPRLLKAVQTNGDGRVDAPLLAGPELLAGDYELVFFVGDYFAEQQPSQPRFLDRVPVRFRITDASASYHVPLLCSPYGYTTYRGS